MHSRIVVLALGIVLAAPRPAAAQTTTEEQKIRAVVTRYLHGLKFNDTTDFKAAFWPDAKLMFLKKDGTLGQLTQTDWYRGFASVAGKEEPGDFAVISVDVTGDAASVKVSETYPTSVYVNYLSFLRIGGTWRIVNKIYTSRAR